MSAVILLSAAVVQAQPAAPQESYAERFTYDPQSGAFQELPAPEPGTPDGDLELARRSLARGDAKAARQQLRQWVRRYGGDSARTPEVLLLQGDAELALGNYMKSHQLYRRLIESYPGSPLVDRAYERDFVVAETYLSGTKRKLLGVRLLPADEEALEILETIASDRPGSDLAAQARRTRAAYFHRTGDFDTAAMEFDRYADEYPRDRYARMAMLRSAQAWLAGFPGVEFDPAPLGEARERFRELRQAYPDFAQQAGVDGLLDQIDLTQAEKAFRTAEYYERVRQPTAARIYYESIDRRWPGTPWAARARQRLAIMGYLADENAPPPVPASAGPDDSTP